MKTNFLVLLFIILGTTAFSQGISVQLLSDPAPDSDGILRVCPGTAVEFTALIDYGSSGGSDETTEFAWSFGESSSIPVLNSPQRVFLFSYESGVIINLSVLDTESSTTASTSIGVEVAGQPDTSELFTDNPGAVFLGEQVDLHASISPSDPGFIPPYSGSYSASGMSLFTSFLPDGTGIPYESTIEISGAASGATITQADDINEIWSTMEHSYLGDLVIGVECPNGTWITLQEQGGGSCNLGFPWATAPVDGQSSVITAGQGLLYSWSMQGEVSLEEGCIVGIEFVSGDGPDTYFDSQVQSGAYAPAEGFEGLIGCPVNGEWKMIYSDNIGADNGYSFGWGITFSDMVLPPDSLYQVASTELYWEDNPVIVGGTGGNVTIEPIETGVIDMELVVIDEIGCEHRVPFPINVYDPLSVEELSAIPFRIFVNGQVINVITEGETMEKQQLDILDMRGALISSTQFAGQTQITVPQSGVYLLTLIDSYGLTSRRKVVIP